MGTLLGHALPGSFFFLYSIWRVIQIARRVQLLAYCRRERPYESFGGVGRHRDYDSRSTGTRSEGSRRNLRHPSKRGLILEVQAAVEKTAGATVSDNELDFLDEAATQVIQQSTTFNTQPSTAKKEWKIVQIPPIPKYYTSATYPCCIGTCARWPVEGLAKILASGVGMVGELIASMNGKLGPIKWWGDIQHVTMYSFFLLSGIVDVLRWKRFSWVVPGMDFFALAQAFVGEWLMFSHHVQGVHDLEMMLHKLLLYIIAATIVTVLLEYVLTHSLCTALVTTFLSLLQGTWFIQVGLILYPPSDQLEWQLDEDDKMMMVVAVFGWHCAIDFVVVITLYVGLVNLFQRCCVPSEWEVWDQVLLEGCVQEAEESSSYGLIEDST